MCYDISFNVQIRQLSDYFPGLIFDEQMNMEFGMLDHVQGVAVFGDYPVIYENKDDGKLHCRFMSWGIVEHYFTEMPSLAKRNGMLNIRSERIFDDPKSYWFKIKSKRCLIPVTGIYEHREIVGWKKKVPYIVKPCDQKLFFLPGLRSVANIVDKSTGEIFKFYSCAIITREANSLMRNIHNAIGENGHRMPLFLPFNTAQQFVSSELSDFEYREILDYEMPSEDLNYHAVYTIRSPKQREDLLGKHELYEWPNLPALGELNPV